MTLKSWAFAVLAIVAVLLAAAPPAADARTLAEIRAAAEQRNAKAQHNLGTMHRKGDGVPKDLNEAVNWLRASAEQGYPDAQDALSKLGK